MLLSHTHNFCRNCSDTGQIQLELPTLHPRALLPRSRSRSLPGRRQLGHSPVIHARYPGPQGHAQSWEHSIPKRLLAALPQTTAPKYPHGTFPLSLDFFISLLAVARCHGLSSPQGAAQALCFPAHFHICSCESLQDAGLSSPVAVALRNYWRWIMP